MARNARSVKPRFWLILMALFLSVFAYVTSTQNELLAQQNAVIEEQTMATEDMEVKIVTSQRRLVFSRSDDYIESNARSDLGLVMPDEVLYVQQNND